MCWVRNLIALLEILKEDRPEKMQVKDRWQEEAGEDGLGCRGVRKVQEEKHKTEGELGLHGSVGNPEPSGTILPLPITALGNVP